MIHNLNTQDVNDVMFYADWFIQLNVDLAIKGSFKISNRHFKVYPYTSHIDEVLCMKTFLK